MSKGFQLMKGNEAIAEAALRAGCRFYAGYPITPQSEILEYMSANMADRGGVFVQGESEIASISMIWGAAACGERVMTDRKSTRLNSSHSLSSRMPSSA